jgi:broad-specificity NMP kinase
MERTYSSVLSTAQISNVSFKALYERLQQTGRNYKKVPDNVKCRILHYTATDNSPFSSFGDFESAATEL